MPDVLDYFGRPPKRPWTMPPWRKLRKPLAGIFIVVIALGLFPVQVCHTWALMDVNTGSSTGYTEWFFGLRTNRWYRESALEKFMREKHPSALQQNWVSYAGAGHNIYGMRLVSGHGRPGAILLISRCGLDDYCAQASDAEKKRLYDAFLRGDQKEIHALANEIVDALIAANDKSRANGDAPNEGR